MKTYIIIFEITDLDRENKFYEKLKNYPQWAMITKKAFAIKAELSSVELRNELCENLSETDRLMVVLSGHVAAWKNSYCKNEWLKENL